MSDSQGGTATQEKLTAEKPEDFVLVGLQREAKAMRSAMKAGMPALLIGETGTGKTSLAKQVARDMGRGIIRVNLDGGTTADELVGRFMLRPVGEGQMETYYQYGAIPHAMKNGSVLILDEINAASPETLFVIHALLEDDPRLYIPETEEEIKPAQGFTVVATMNPPHDYAGTKALNAALYSRFGVVLRFAPLTGDMLMEALHAHVPGADISVVTSVAHFIEVVETLRKNNQIETRVTIREGVNALKLSMDGLNFEEAKEAALYYRLEEYELQEIVNHAKEFVIPNKENLDRYKSVKTMVELARKAGALQKQLNQKEQELSKLRHIAQVIAQAQQEGTITDGGDSEGS